MTKHWTRFPRAFVSPPTRVIQNPTWNSPEHPALAVPALGTGWAPGLLPASVMDTRSTKCSDRSLWKLLASLVCSWIFLQLPHFEGPNDHPGPNQHKDMRKGLCRVYHLLHLCTDPVPSGHGWLISGITAIFKHYIVVI